MSFLSNRLKFFDSSDFREAVYLQQRLTDPIDLSVGVPEELTPEHVKAAGIKAIENDKTTYTPSNGIQELRVAISLKLAHENNIDTEEDSVTIVPGLTTGQLLVYMAILDPGDEIIVMDPYYPPYPHLASAVGGVVVHVNTLHNFQPDLDAIEASITHRTKAIVVNSPNNPTGAVYPPDTLVKISEIAEKHNVLVISDEIYEHFVLDGEHFSIGSINKNTLTMNGFSKSYAMTGWRIGYIVGPHEIISAINELQQYTVMSSSSIAQHAAMAAIQRPPELTGRYRTKRDFVKSKMEDLGYEMNGMQGAFFAFAKAPSDLTDLEFVKRAADHNLILVPGRAFSARHSYFRISYGAPMEELRRGLEVIKQISHE